MGDLKGGKMPPQINSSNDIVGLYSFLRISAMMIHRGETKGNQQGELR